MSAFVKSIAAGQTSAERPSFNFTYNRTTGAVTVRLTGGPAPEHVYLRHAQTLSDKRRDFRWVRIVNESTGDKCSLPGIPLKKKVEGGGNCLQPMFWHKDRLSPSATTSVEPTDGHAAAGAVYTGTPPAPKKGHYTGYYIEMIYEKDGAGHLQISTPGFVWPNTLPYSDCLLRKGAPNECKGSLV